jgi:hypothetical protein
MIFKELKENPKDGFYKVLNKDIFIVVEGNKVVHSPYRKSIRDDEKIIKLKKGS